MKDSDLKAMDCQISELSAEVQTLSQSCRQLDAGGGRDICIVKTCFAWCINPLDRPHFSQYLGVGEKGVVCTRV